MTLTDVTNNIPAVTALIVAITGLVGALVAGWIKLKGISTTQDTIVAASAQRDTILAEVHAAVGAIPVTTTEPIVPAAPATPAETPNAKASEVKP